MRVRLPISQDNYALLPLLLTGQQIKGFILMARQGFVKPNPSSLVAPRRPAPPARHAVPGRGFTPTAGAVSWPSIDSSLFVCNVKHHGFVYPSLLPVCVQNIVLLIMPQQGNW